MSNTEGARKLRIGFTAAITARLSNAKEGKLGPGHPDAELNERRSIHKKGWAMLV
jgi:hypothetical protein